MKRKKKTEEEINMTLSSLILLPILVLLVIPILTKMELLQNSILYIQSIILFTTGSVGIRACQKISVKKSKKAGVWLLSIFNILASLEVLMSLNI